MEDYRSQLEERLQQVETLIAIAEKRLNRSKKTEKQSVSISVHNKKFQYYRVLENGKKIYIKSKDVQLVQRSFQREYDEEVLEVLQRTRYRIERFLELYDPLAIEGVYSNLCEGRKVLVTPIIQTDEEYTREWMESHPGRQNDYPAAITYLTERGEQVRSKSEKILADLFLKYGIPYCYEPELILKDGRKIYPDFGLLNLHSRKTVYWEHFGLVSDGEYAHKAFWKLYKYEAEGLEVGRDILFSVESENTPLDQKELEKKIKRILRPCV